MFWRHKLWQQSSRQGQSIRIRVSVGSANRSPAPGCCLDKCLQPARHAAGKIQIAARSSYVQWIRIAGWIKKTAKTFEVDDSLQPRIEIREPEQKFVMRHALIDATVH